MKRNILQIDSLNESIKIQIEVLGYKYIVKSDEYNNDEDNQNALEIHLVVKKDDKYYFNDYITGYCSNVFSSCDEYLKNKKYNIMFGISEFLSPLINISFFNTEIDFVSTLKFSMKNGDEEDFVNLSLELKTNLLKKEYLNFIFECLKTFPNRSDKLVSNYGILDLNEEYKNLD